MWWVEEHKGTLMICVVFIIAALLFFGANPVGVRLWNHWFHVVQVADDETNYETLKAVEDTCRAMQSTYITDKLTWEQYKDSTDSEEKAWAMSARTRANATAANYNNYMLKNSYVWEHNVPKDIATELEYIGS